MVRAVPSRSNAPVTVKLIVVPIEAASASRKRPALNPPLTTFVAAAAAVAAVLAAVVIPVVLGTVIFGVVVVVVGEPLGPVKPEANGIAPVEGASDTPPLLFASALAAAKTPAAIATAATPASGLSAK
jgi:hypothetical protein